MRFGPDKLLVDLEIVADTETLPRVMKRSLLARVATDLGRQLR
jgi:hypothetical protein